MQPYTTGAVYVNYLERDEDARITLRLHAATYQRLQALKKDYDPANLFRANYNIPPGK